ncbi:hypothetical protein [Sphingomonas beigongshangi]|uniref:hypothetical protein n=1 Tax=Sphingomonas beigongshangi TaxID=2782540 RepID=UPI001AEDA231|nr:hypothetical protein [Sphingomonas beigongshangi]
MRNLDQQPSTISDRHERQASTTAVADMESTGRAPLGQVIPTALAKFEDLRIRLDSGEVRLRRAMHGKCNMGHALKLAGVSPTALVRHLEIKTAFEQLVEGRPMDEPDQQDPRPYDRVIDYMKRLEKLTRRLASREVALRRDEEGRLDREYVAALAGLPPGWKQHKRVIDAIAQMAIEFPEATPVSIDEQEALAQLDAYDAKLLLDQGRVPSFFGRPSIGLASIVIGLPAEAIAKSERLRERFEAIAIRHGIAAPPKEGGKEGVVYLTMRKLHDEFDTAVLRGTDFPTLTTGMLDHHALLALCGVPSDLIIQTKVRTTAIALHRDLRQAIGMAPVPADAALLGAAHAVLDCYELHVAAGVVPVPTMSDGTVDVARVEHRYQLTSGTAKRFAEIQTRIEAIAPVSNEAAAHARARLDVALVLAIELYAKILSAHSRKFKCDRDGRPSYAVIETAMYLRSGSIASSKMAQDAITNLAHDVGKRVYGRDWSAERIAPLVDLYIAHIRERGYRWPRKSAFGDYISRPGVCAEILALTGEHVSVDELSWHWLVRIRSRCKDVPQPGSVEKAQEPNADIAPFELSLEVLRKALGRFKDGLPADPLDDRIYDLNEIAEATWIDVATLGRTPAYLACIDEHARKFGLKPFVYAAAAITIEQLLDHGRAKRWAETTSAKPGEAAARTTRALLDAMLRSGLSLADEATRIPELSALSSGEAAVGSQLERWRGYLAAMRRDQMLPDSFPRSLKILMRSSGMDFRQLIGRLRKLSGTRIDKATIKNWVSGAREPSHAQQRTVDLIEEIFNLEKGTLTAKLCADSRTRGPFEIAPDGIPIPKGFDAHLPFDYPELLPTRQREVLNFVVDSVFTQDAAHSLRQRVVMIDKYRLPLRDWPDHLKDEWRRYLKTRVVRDDAMEIGAEIDEEDGGSDPSGRSRQAKFLTAGGGARLTSHLETFFGFLHRSVALEAPFTGVRDNTPGWRREKAEEIARAADYKPMPGLGVPLEHLTIGALAVRDFYRAFVKFQIGRSTDDSRNSISVANFFEILVDVDGFVRNDQSMQQRTADLLSWWRNEQALELRRKFAKLPVVDTDEQWKTACEGAAQLYRLRYEKLNDRLHGRKNSKPIRRLRDPFAPIEKVLASASPRRYYRRAIQRMIAARPTQIRLRHVWLRDCILALILFRTLLRIKNLARLTYKADNTGQLRREGKTWVVQIHKDNFKNRDGKYFIGGDYFRMTLNNDDGLYEMLDQYINMTRQHFLGRRGEIDSDERNILAEARGHDGFFDDLLDFDDGEADDDRFFLNENGQPFSASYLSARYYVMTKRHLVHNRFRRRGMRGIMPHGPHCVRHIGATAVLKNGGTFFQAGRVIQDSEESARKCYSKWGPADNGKSAGDLLDACS